MSRWVFAVVLGFSLRYVILLPYDLVKVTWSRASPAYCLLVLELGGGASIGVSVRSTCSSYLSVSIPMAYPYICSYLSVNTPIAFNPSSALTSV